MQFLIFPLFAISFFLNAYAISKIRLKSLSFIDGITIGMMYYITIPMVLILQAGRMSAQIFNVPDYVPLEHIFTTIVILLTIMVVSYFSMYIRPAKEKDVNANDGAPIVFTTVTLIVISYVAFRIALYLISGVYSGGHWAESTHKILGSGGIFTLLMFHYANFSRMAIFGLLLYVLVKQPNYRLSVCIIAGIMALFDTALSFNRIAILYFLVLFIVAYQNRRIFVSSVFLVFLFAGSYLSLLWTGLRGALSTHGYNLTAFSSAIGYSMDYIRRYNTSLAELSNGIFESINIAVLNYVVQNGQSGLDLSPLDYIARPLFFFVPRAIWEDRPEVFGSLLGRWIEGNSSLALNSTLIGEPFGTFGFAWLLAIMGFVLFYQFLFGILDRYARGANYVAFFVGIACWRFDSAFPMISLFFVIFIVVLNQFISLLSTPKPGIRRRE